MAEMLDRRRSDPMLRNLPPGAPLEANMPDPGSPSEAMAQAVVADLMEQERSAMREKAIAEVAKNGLPGGKKKKKRGAGGCCGGKPRKP